MTDETSRRGKSGRPRINVNETHELVTWAQRFNISPEKLKDAVTKVGPLPENVAKYLQKEF